MIQKILFFFILLTFGHIGVYAQDSIQTKQFATVYLVRSTGTHKSSSAMSAFMDDALLCRLNNNKYSIHTVEPGLHKFKAQYDGKKPSKRIETLDLKLDGGQTYYISLDVTNYMYHQTLYLIEITQNSFKRIFQSLKEDSKCD